MDCILTYQFLKKLFEAFTLSFNEAIERGRIKGYIEDCDLQKDRALDRKTAAGIVHGFIKYELGISDLEDIERAYVLKDIFDCHVCVNNIAQVYLRGIMDGRNLNGNLLFLSKEAVSENEAELIIKRIKNISKKESGKT